MRIVHLGLHNGHDSIQYNSSIYVSTVLSGKPATLNASSVSEFSIGKDI